MIFVHEPHKTSPQIIPFVNFVEEKSKNSSIAAFGDFV
jgi:hypothetical protein